MTARPDTPPPLPVTCLECGAAMYWLGARHTFEGDYSISTYRLECRETGCQTTAELTYRTFIPIDVARQRAAAACPGVKCMPHAAYCANCATRLVFVDGEWRHG